MKNEKTYVWSFLGRFSHWMLVMSLFTCYLSSFYENLLTLHVSLGIVVFGMLLMKIVWGLIGPRYARWSDFDFDFSNFKYYFVEKIQNRYREIPAGHNPASSWFAFLVTWIGICCCLVGYILYGIQEGNGLTSFLNTEYYYLMDLYNEIHIILVYVLIVMIFFHVSGVLVEQFYHKTNMIMAMISGYKKAKGVDIKPRFHMLFFGSLYTFFVFLLFFYVYCTPDNIFIKSKFEKIDYDVLHRDFKFECGDCHNLIPPHLLPKDAWIKLMKEQEDHYGEDLELSKSLAQSIKNFLVENSAETSSKEAAYKFLLEIQKSKNFTISKSEYWKKRHQNIPKSVFKSDAVESKSNCAACHKHFEEGLLFDDYIKDSPLK